MANVRARGHTRVGCRGLLLPQIVVEKGAVGCGLLVCSLHMSVLVVTAPSIVYVCVCCPSHHRWCVGA
jgi:hypothetical protein